MPFPGGHWGQTHAYFNLSRHLSLPFPLPGMTSSASIPGDLLKSIHAYVCLFYLCPQGAILCLASEQVFKTICWMSEWHVREQGKMKELLKSQYLLLAGFSGSWGAMPQSFLCVSTAHQIPSAVTLSTHMALGTSLPSWGHSVPYFYISST